MRRRNRHSDEDFALNATSTADISFILLIFFLVTSSMGSDKGMLRQLPPNQPDQVEEATIEKDNLMQVALDAEGKLSVNDTLVIDDEQFINSVCAFVTERGKEHLITLKSDAECPFQAYFHTQQTLSKAYLQLRNAMAMERFKHDFASCTEEERTILLEECPQRVAEDYVKNTVATQNKDKK